LQLIEAHFLHFCFILILISLLQARLHRNKGLMIKIIPEIHLHQHFFVIFIIYFGNRLKIFFLISKFHYSSFGFKKLHFLPQFPITNFQLKDFISWTNFYDLIV
jgi:hypothetical protein